MSSIYTVQPSGKRDVFIDVARLLTMLFIIMGHVNIRTPHGEGWSSSLCMLVSFTACCGVPFFFFMAGYFSKPVSGGLNWRRTWEIFRSMVFWCIVGYFWFGALLGREYTFLGEEGILGVLGAWNSVSTPGSWDCWFLKVLLPMVLVSGLLHRLKSAILLCLACLSALLGAADCEGEWLPYFFSSKALSGLSYFLCGLLIRRGMGISEISSWIGHIYTYVIGVTWFVVGVGILSALAGFHSLIVFVPGNFVSDIWGIIYVLSLSKALCVILPRFSNWFGAFGAGVFFIYMVQEMLVIQCRWLFTLHPVNKHAYAMVPFGIFAVLMLGYWLVRRYMPWACGVLCLSPVKKNG